MKKNNTIVRIGSRWKSDDYDLVYTVIALYGGGGIWTDCLCEDQYHEHYRYLACTILAGCERVR